MCRQQVSKSPPLFLLTQSLGYDRAACRAMVLAIPLREKLTERDAALGEFWDFGDTCDYCEFSDDQPVVARSSKKSQESPKKVPRVH